jgi:hypothetical protein
MFRDGAYAQLAMRLRMKLALAAFAGGVSLSALAQGTFQNLDFEDANPIAAGMNGPFSEVTAASAFPYWTVTVGGVQQTEVPEDGSSIGTPLVFLIGPPPGGNPIDGSYSVDFYSSVLAVSIEQTGVIPPGTQSLLFEAKGEAYGQVGLDVSIGNQNIPFAAVGTGPNYTLYGANISAWAGQNEELTFSALGNATGPSMWLIDDISFSPNATVPEPSPLALAGIGGVLFALYRRYAPERRWKA